MNVISTNLTEVTIPDTHAFKQQGADWQYDDKGLGFWKDVSTGLPLGTPTGLCDMNGVMIYTNHMLAEVHNQCGTVFEIDVWVAKGEVEYRITNYHCSSCPLDYKHSVVMGVLVNDGEWMPYVDNGYVE